MTDFEDVYKDDNRVVVRFKHGKHEYELKFNHWIEDNFGEKTESAVMFYLTSDPNPDWKKQGLTQSFGPQEFGKLLNKLKEISTYDDKE